MPKKKKIETKKTKEVVNKKRTHQICLRVDDDLYDYILLTSESTGATTSEIVREALKEYFNGGK